MQGMRLKASLVTRVVVPSSKEEDHQLIANAAICGLPSRLLHWKFVSSPKDTSDLLKSVSPNQSFANGSLQLQPSTSLILHLHSFIPLQQN